MHGFCCVIVVQCWIFLHNIGGVSHWLHFDTEIGVLSYELLTECLEWPSESDHVSSDFYGHDPLTIQQVEFILKQRSRKILREHNFHDLIFLNHFITDHFNDFGCLNFRSVSSDKRCLNEEKKRKNKPLRLFNWILGKSWWLYSEWCDATAFAWIICCL